MRRPLRTVSLRRNKPSKLCPVAYFVTDLAMEGWPHLLVLDRQHCDPLCCHLWCGERTRRTKLTRAGTPGDCISKSPSRSPAAASASLSWWGRDDSILCALLVHQLSRSRPSGALSRWFRVPVLAHRGASGVSLILWLVASLLVRR
jgi:hypothetical protein